MGTSSEPIIEIRNVVLAHTHRGDHDKPSQVVIHRGDVVAVESEARLDGRHLLRVMATLDRPDQGDYWFKGKRVNLKSHRQCLAIKRQIGYVAADAAMISNRSLRENLLLTRYYYGNALHIDIDETVRCLCSDAGLAHKLDQRPAVLSRMELLKAITIREMAKNPALMLIELPEHYMQMKTSDGLFRHLKTMVRSNAAVVFFSDDSTLIGLANRRLTLVGGTIRTVIA